MPVPLYTASVSAFLQTLPKVPGLIDKARAWCAQTGMSEADLADRRLAPDMWNFAKQIALTANFSARCLACAQAGHFIPDTSEPPADFDVLRTIVCDAIEYMEALDPATVEALVGQKVRFEYMERRMLFTAEDFLLSYALPNFYFHATTAYAILRGLGVELGKGDWLGTMRTLERFPINQDRKP